MAEVSKGGDGSADILRYDERIARIPPAPQTGKGIRAIFRRPVATGRKMR